MKRIGYVCKEMEERNFCNRVILDAIYNKRKTPFIQHVKENYKEYGEELQQTLIDG